MKLVTVGNTWALVLAVVGSCLPTFVTPVVAAEVSPPRNVVEEARQLQRQGANREAFLKYLQVPGGEAAAIAVARCEGKVRPFLDLLRKNSETLPAASAKITEGDLLLALKDQRGALACYRAAAALISTKPDAEPGMLAGDSYFVEYVNHSQPGGFSPDFAQILPPFQFGPGSHRDNRLIRRFISLEAWEDAEREFARVWQLHRAAARPFVMSVPVWGKQPDNPGPADALHAENFDPLPPPQQFEKQLFRPAGFNGQGLQFALDYAYFLQRRKNAAAANRVLIEPLLAIDMDRNPNIHQIGEPLPADQPLPAPERILRVREGWIGRSSGVSRKEFLRLVYGDFQTRSELVALLEPLQVQIAKNENRARRTLARILGHHGEPQKALELELQYIDAGRFDPLIAAYRRGLVFDDARKLAEATDAFEQVLTLPLPEGTMANVPDPEEVSSDHGQFGQASAFTESWGRGMAVKQLRPTAIEKLFRLYAAQGIVDKGLELHLRQIELEPWRLADVRILEQLVQQFRAANQAERMTNWLAQRLNEAKAPETIAALSWITGDHARAARSVAAMSDNHHTAAIETWKELFRNSDPAQYKVLLSLLAKANPKDGRTRLELLDLEDRLDGDEAIESLELLLASNAQPAFVYGKGQRNRTSFTGYPDLAYRLMRLYERNGKRDLLTQLGLRIARGEKPFDVETRQRTRGGSDEEYVTWGNACLALAIQHADDQATQAALAAALKDSRWPVARRQLDRRSAGPWKPNPAERKIPWANVAAGIELMVSHDNVLCLAHDERFVYVGYPWGVAVYSHAGEPETQIAMEEAARSLVVLAGNVWAGTPKGLFRINPDQWTVAWQTLDADAPRDREERLDFNNGINCLAVDGDLLWIGLRRNVQVLNTKTLELRAFSLDEMDYQNPGDIRRIFVDGQYVWAVGWPGTRRWDRRTDEWSSVASIGPRDPTQLIAIADGTLFGDCYVDDRLRHRLCTIDRESRAVTVIPLVSNPGRELVNQPFQYVGTSQGIAGAKTQPAWAGKHLFRADYGMYYFDEQAQQLKSVPQSTFDDLHESLRIREQKRAPMDPVMTSVWQMLDRRAEFVARLGIPSEPDRTTVTLPNGMLVTGQRLGRTRFEYPQEDRPTWSDSLHDLDDAEGGLFFISGGQQPGNADVPAITRGRSSLSADRVYGVTEADRCGWVCTDRGVVVLDPAANIVDRFSRSTGLCANCVLDAALLRGRLYFATSWDDSKGGLAVFDPKTATFTALHQSDGLSTDNLKEVTANGDQLTVTFSVEYLRFTNSQQRWRLFPPATFNPVTRTFKSGGPPKLMDDSGLRTLDPLRENPIAHFEAMPLLGGHLLQKRSLLGKTFLCGTRGLVLIDERNADKPLASLEVPKLGAKLVPSAYSQQLADARSRKTSVQTARQLAIAMQDANPLYRANALASILNGPVPSEKDYVPLIAGALASHNRRERSTAMAVLVRFQDNGLVIPLLKTQLESAERPIRDAAILELVRRDAVPEIALLKEFFVPQQSSQILFGAESSISLTNGFTSMYAALAPRATKEIFGLLIENPPRLNDWDHKRTVFPQLGQSLLKNREALPRLLSVRAEEGRQDQHVEFVRHVLQFAGKEILPPLHIALKSEDRVIRSNAARGCGAIGDPSSIQPLIQALDLESGLSRASIVWALGELRSKESLPILARLYVDARNDEKQYGSSQRAGFRASQSAATMASQYDSLSSLDAIGTEWSELTTSALTPIVDPLQQEDLLQPRHLLDAVAKIGTAESQVFYRTLAAESGDEFREEAAIRLGSAGAVDRDRNITVLKSLLTSVSPRVRIAAATSLLILGESDGRQPILDGLVSPDWGYTLQQLRRLGNGQCRFARQEIEVIAKDPAKSKEIRELANAILMNQAR